MKRKQLIAQMLRNNRDIYRDMSQSLTAARRISDSGQMLMSKAYANRVGFTLVRWTLQERLFSNKENR